MSGGAYIEGNTLVLGDSSYLEHHGILGQKWGVRRFQNKDGSRTTEGKKRYKTMRAAHGTRARGNSPFDRAKNQAIDKAKAEFNELLDNARYGKNKAKYDAAVDEWDKAQTHRYDEYEKEFDKYASIAGMANAYRWGWDQPNAGFGSRDKMLEFAADFYKYDDGDQGKFNSYDYFLVGKGENPNDVQDRAFKASSAMWDLAKEDAKDLFGDLADKKDGPGSTVATSFASSMFDYATAASPITMVDESSGLRYTDKEIKQMQEDIRKFSDEAKRLGTISHSGIFVEDGTLYLEHHGVKGQRWGVRRFQNKDGSLTNAGRKRLGYSTKDVKSAVIKGGKTVGGAVATVGKAGYNLGKKAAVAVKAHSEKKKAEKLEKKKEKASKTRLGVVRNADLFTAAEMAELNKKFKAKDEMTLASLQKGADYFRLAAGMVGSVASINKDFESMTGKSLIPNPVKKEKEKREADERAEDRARKLAKEDAEEDRKRRADERKSRADEIDFKNKSEDLKNKKSEELRKQAAEARAQAKQTWDEAQAAEKTRAMKGVADENEAKAAIKRQELKTNEIAQREEAVAKREAATKSQEEQNEANRKLILNYARDLDTLRDTLNKATDELRNADNVTEQRRKEIWEAIKKAQDDALKHDDMDGLYLEHHGIKGQRWGVRRFQNPDGTLTDKGRKHYQKKLDLEDRKLTAAKAAQGKYERVRTPMSVGMAVIGAIAGGIAGSPAGPAGIAAGAAFVSAISGGSTYAEYTVKGIFAGHGANRSKQKIAKYKDMLKQDAFIVEDGTLYLEHFGIKNMKWGVRRFQNKDGSLTEAGRKRYGSGNDDEELSGGGGGGGAPEEDEEMKKKIEEAAKKAGMTVAEYRKKMGSKLYDMFGGKYKKEAETQRNRANAFNNEAQKYSREYNKQKATQASESRKADKAETSGDFRKHVNNMNSAKVSAKTSYRRKTEAENARLHSVIDANKAQDKYEKSLAGRYDKFKADRERKDRMKRDKMIEDAFRKETPGRMPAPSKKENVIARASVAAKAAGRVASDVASGNGRPKSAKKVYGDFKNRADIATMQALGKIRSDDEKTMKDGMYKNRQWRARADYAEKRGDKKTAEKYRKMSDDELYRSDYADKEKDIVDKMGDAVYKNYMLRNKKHADNARSARTDQWRNRVAGDRAERRMNTSGAKIKAKLKSGQLPVAEAGQYASAARDRVKAEVGGKLATRKYNKSVNAMGEALASGAKDYINTPKVKKKLT